MAFKRLKGADGGVRYVSTGVIKEGDPILKTSKTAKVGETYADLALRQGASLYDDPNVNIKPQGVSSAIGSDPIRTSGPQPMLPNFKDTTKPNIVEPELTPQLQVTPPTQVPTGPTTEQLRASLIQAEEQQKIADLTRSTEQALQAVRRREEGIAPRIKGLKSTASVGTQLGQKRLKDLFAATGAAVGTGAARQIAAEQGLQSQLGALDVQEAQERADVARDLSDIQSEKAFLERRIRAGAETARTQAQLEDLQAEQAKAAREAEINSEREFKIFEANLQHFNDKELIGLQNDLSRENTLLDAEIQRLRDSQLFEQDQVMKQQLFQQEQALLDRRSQNDIKLEGIRSANTQAEIRARGAESRATAQFQSDLDGDVIEDTSYTIPVIRRVLDGEIDRNTNPDKPMTTDATKNLVMMELTNNPQWIGQNAQKLQQVLDEYGIEPRELQAFEEWRESALADRPFE